MKIFCVGSTLSKNISRAATLLLVVVLTACATKHEQYGKNAIVAVQPETTPATAALQHRFYLIGDAGYADSPHSQRLLGVISDHLKQEGRHTSLLYLGDNVYPLGMPQTDKKGREEAEASLNSQMALAGLFKGSTYFIPGNHDWYHGLKGLEEQEKYITRFLKDKKAFLPGKGCAINDVEITDSITMIVIDTQWYLENWDNYPTINDDCSIKTREAFFLELESLLNKNQNKTILLAMHHPIMSGGAHGGQFSARAQLFPLPYAVPLPVLGSFANILRSTGGVIDQDLQSKEYNTLSKRIKTLIQGNNNVIVVSGHDHNLQYLEKDNVTQIISGAGSKEEPARAMGANDFSYGGRGYAVLDMLTDGTARVAYYKVSGSGEELVYSKRLLENNKAAIPNYSFPKQFPKDTTATIYSAKETTYGGAYRFLFGTHYRRYYSTPVKAQVVVVDTLYGGLTVTRAGGGHQSNSLRLLHASGKEYVMRAQRKDASRFLQSTAFKTRYIGNEFEDTFTERFLLDFYTTAHPYTPYIIGALSDAAGVYHSNPRLFYIPKQPALGNYNSTYGDGLYMIEERPTDEFSKLESFGNADGIDGTDDVHEKLEKSKKNVIDEKAYIRARLFDFAIGDWDRHSDQWRWAKFKTADSTYYRPIPRDRDQAFPKIDGALLTILMKMPALRKMKTYSDDIPNIKWQAKQAYTQDLAFITKSGEKEWLEQARYIKANLTDAVIDAAFAQLPPEVTDSTTDEIKKNLKSRRDKLEKYALEYRKVLLRTVLLTGTHKKDKFVITRTPDGLTQVEHYSVSKSGDSLVFSHKYSKDETKELWIYGLDDDDVFEVKGKSRRGIMLRLIGGQNHDAYTVEDGNRVRIYDFKSKENTYNAADATLHLTDDYETNSYDYKKPDYNLWMGYPMVGYNPDDGVKAGVVASYTVNNFNRRPFSRKHTFGANYFFATNGFEFTYSGKVMNVESKWNLGLDARYTSPNFSINYFGLGNETVNNDNDLGMDYNRVKLQVFRVSPSLFKQGANGSFVELKADFETIEVDGTNNRFVNQPGVIKPYLFEHLQYGGAQAMYRFENYDNASMPAMGMQFYVKAGWKASFDMFNRNFAHAETGLTFYHRLTRKRLVLVSGVRGKFIFNNNYEFYQASTLGGDADLRGYRRERFAGNDAFLHSTDLRFTLARVKSFVPLTYGVSGGYDYGRVWLHGEDSNKWHQSAGAGIWVNGADALTARVNYFHGSDGGRVTFGMSLGL